MSDNPSVLLCHPFGLTIHPDSVDAGTNAARYVPDYTVQYVRPQTSLLCNSFNIGVALAKRERSDFFALLHSDVVPTENWLAVMLVEMEKVELDILHAPCAIKDMSGVTSTAIAFSSDIWGPKRRITVKELAKLPPTFTIYDVRKAIDPDAEILLPNTGCLLMRCSNCFQSWEGFHTEDRVVEVADGHYEARVVPEDWLLGFEAERKGLRVGGTRRVPTLHVGQLSFSTGGDWGKETDEAYTRHANKLQEAAS